MSRHFFPAPPVEGMPSNEEAELYNAFERYDRAIRNGQNLDQERRFLVRKLIELFGQNAQQPE